VNDDKAMQLEYLLVFKFSNTIHSNIFKDIDSYFRTKITKNLADEKIMITKVGSKRLMKELAGLQKGNDKMDDSGLRYIFEIDDVDMTKVKLKLPLDNFDKDGDLYRDLIRYGYDAVHIEMNMPERYPFSPPFVRIVSPRFKIYDRTYYQWREYLYGDINKPRLVCWIKYYKSIDCVEVRNDCWWC
jgi:hypothetical protein